MEELCRLELERTTSTLPMMKRSPASTTQKRKKKLSVERKEPETIVITKCLIKPCPRIYTDSLSESILIHCKDPIHAKGKQNK